MVFGAAMGFALLSSLSGCDGNVPTLRRIANILDIGNNSLSDSSLRELERFNSVYDEYVLPGADDTGSLDIFRDVLGRLRASYVRDVTAARLVDTAIKGVRDLKAKPHSLPPQKLVEAALDSMLTSLDPHSSYLNPDEFNELKVSTRGEFGGLGMEVSMKDGLIVVVSPIEDTPAYRAGIKPGDIITHLDGVPIKGMTLMGAVRRMRGPPGTSLSLSIVRSGGAPFTISIMRELINVRAVKWRIEGDIGYVRVSRFNEKVGKGVEDAFRSINRQLGRRMKGVVLDLRNNPGGLLDQSLILADDFLNDGVIVSIRGRDPGKNRTSYAEVGDITGGVPLVVLVNGGSASASEIVAGALQDRKRATIMGLESFGKGSVQTITPLRGGGAIKFTTELYYTPSGRAIQARGVEPDIIINSTTPPVSKMHEADLPGALPAVAAAKKHSGLTINEALCPLAGDRKDRQLGCALVFLHSGSKEKFLAVIKSRQQI